MVDLLLMDGDSGARAHHYREKAEEIRRAAGLLKSLDIARELLEIAVRFDRMAAHFEKIAIAE